MKKKTSKKIEMAKYDYSDMNKLFAPWEMPKSQRVLPKKLRKVLDKEVADMKEHFEEDGWNLDKQVIIDTVLSQYFGFDIIGEIQNILSAESGVVITGKDFKLDGEYSPVYYDTYKNKIIIIKSPKDKSYVMEHLEKDGYIHLGRL
jgi:hypothetical protein